MVPPPLSAHPSRGSWPHRELHRRPQGPRSHAVPPPLSAHPHEDRGLIGSSTEGPRGRGHMGYRPRFRRTPHEDRGLRELHRRPQGPRPHRGSDPVRHAPHEDRGLIWGLYRSTPYEDRGLIWSSTEGPSRRVRMRPPSNISARPARGSRPPPPSPLLQGAPPRAPKAGFAPLAVPDRRADAQISRNGLHADVTRCD